MKAKKSFKKFLKGQRKFWASETGKHLIDFLVQLFAGLIAGYVLTLIR